MPIPKPRKDETKKDYIQRCMIDDVMTYEYEDIDQRLGVCSTHYEETKLEKGEPHYTKDGKEYTGPTHKDASGRLMTGKVHTEDSEYLYHKDELPVELESYTDYPEQATENAKIAIRYAEENGWGDCGTAVGKARANQLAKGEPISEDTIARMASFERHRQNSDKELGDGCGRLMWLAWGGDAGVEWAQRKLEQIRTK